MAAKKKKSKKKRRPRGRRAFWSGAISFGLVNVPVELFPSARRTRVSLRMLGEDGTPLRRRYYDPETGETVEGDEIIRGYETEEGDYVLVTDEELEAIAPKKSREIDLRRFVDLEEIPPLFFERAYYLTPSGETTKAYRLLARVLEQSERAGIASFVMRGKEYLVAILAEEGILHAQVLRYEEEIRAPSQVGLPEEQQRDPGQVKRFAKAIRSASTDELDRAELEDAYSKRVRERVEEKRKRGEDVVSAAPQADAEEPGGEQDLLETIRRSLQVQEDGSSRDGQGETEDLEALTKDELYERAQEADISGRSKMKKVELVEALRATQ